MPCEAKRYSDQMHCGRCGTQWDINDPDPPQCATAEQRHETGRLRGGYSEKTPTIESIRAMIKEPPQLKATEPEPDRFVKAREKMRIRSRTQFPNIPPDILDSIIFQTINEVKNPH